MNRGAWRATVHGVAKGWTRLSTHAYFSCSPQHTVFYSCKQWKQCQTLFWGGSKITVEKEMATHSSVLAWRIPGTGEPGGLQSMGLHRVGHY